jgi:hypothetical protein
MQVQGHFDDSAQRRCLTRFEASELEQLCEHDASFKVVILQLSSKVLLATPADPPTSCLHSFGPVQGRGPQTVVHRRASPSLGT